MMNDDAHVPVISHTALHAGFTVIYLLLISWCFFNIFSQIDERFIAFYQLLNRFSKPFYRPFQSPLVWVDVQAVLYALFSFGFLHGAITHATPKDTDTRMLSTLVNVFRATFFLTATLLALLIVVRLSIDTYRDLTGRGRPVIGVERLLSAPENNSNAAR